jgi:hypothetical protein
MLAIFFYSVHRLGRNRKLITSTLSFYLTGTLLQSYERELNTRIHDKMDIPRAFALTILGAAAGAGLFSSRKGSMLFELGHTGYPFSLACTGESASQKDTCATVKLVLCI